VACSLALPPTNLGPVALVALMPLLWLLRRATPRRGFLLGFAFGVAYFGAVLYWILLFGELAWIALVVVSALFLGAFGALAPVVWRGRHPIASTFSLAALWTTLEWLRAMFPLGGFAWGGLASTQVGNPALLPLASVTGGWGITFVVVAVNGLLLLALERWRGSRASAAILALIAASLVLAPSLLPAPAPDGRRLSVAAVQVDVRRAEGLGPVAKDRSIARMHAALHRTLAGRAPDLVVWGESSLDPGANDPATLQDVGGAIRAVGAPTLLSTTRPGPTEGLRRDAVLMSATGVELDAYSKVHLVPFGEFVPWRSAVGWISALRQIPYDLTPGERVHPLSGAGLPTIGAVVCYENSFPGIDRTLVGQGAQLLVVLTNNASYERTAASRQHVLLSRLRAVEEGRWVVHAAISGISAIIDPAGGVTAEAGLFRPAVLESEVRASTVRTPYSRLGDWVPWLSMAFALGMAATPRRRERARGAPPPLAPGARTLVVLPTYDERDTIDWVVAGILARPESPDVMVVDDGSPDGTGELVRAIASREPRVRLVERPGKAGLASAYLLGFRAGIDEGYDLIVEMDSDLSHDPEELSALLAATADHDVVVGSRYVPGGSVTNWSRARLWLSRAGNAYARLALGFPLRDATSGYRVYRRDALAALLVEPVRSEGYGFQIELVLRAWQAGFALGEVPITFREREHGQSKISKRIIVEALWLVAVWGAKQRLQPSSATSRGRQAERAGRGPS
jgi:apolipoprotein N-acyltransferase